MDCARSGIEVLVEVMAALRERGLQDKLEVRTHTLAYTEGVRGGERWAEACGDIVLEGGSPGRPWRDEPPPSPSQGEGRRREEELSIGVHHSNMPVFAANDNQGRMRGE